MKIKRFLISLLPVCLIFILTACGCKHEWKEATCINPQTCNLCGVTKGEPIEHSYMDANCENPKRCSFCDATEGKAQGHNYIDGYCSKCYSKDPNYIDLNNYGFSNMYGINAWIRIVEYSFPKNRVLASLSNVRVFQSNHIEYSGVYLDNQDSFLKYPSQNILESNYYEVSRKNQCKYLSNDSFSVYEDGYWEQSTIYERVIDSDNSKVVLKTLNYKSKEEWFVPCELLDFSTVTEYEYDRRYFYISFK